MSRPSFDDVPKNIDYLIKMHIQQHLTDPAAAHLWDARPVGLDGEVTTLLLTTIGRKSGEPRHVPLLYVDDGDGDGYLVIGSKGGNIDPPIWFLNLQANPDCEIRVGKPPIKARARVLDGEAHAQAWKTITDLHHVYAKYQARTERRIPVVRLEPTGD